ncbi:MAG: hypothetical protein M1370_07980 [Bacteroidetes bacterium]|nr:hypothetical protein [Bacteroidota bacterium]
MSRTLVGIVVVVAASALGVGAAAGADPFLGPLVSPSDDTPVLQTWETPLQRSEPPPEASDSIQAVQATPADPTPQPTPPLPGAAWYFGDDWCDGNWSSSPAQGWNWQGAGPGMTQAPTPSAGADGWDRRGMWPGMTRAPAPWAGVGAWGWSQPGSNAGRISIQDAVEVASEYLASHGSGRDVAEVMEFSQNFYAVVREAQTGRGAFELLIDPYTGAVSPEMGPNMMWNLKYGHTGGVGDSNLTLEEARQLAQQALDANVPGAEIEGVGTGFYGYYTFDYAIDSQVAGMLSVNGLTGEVWPHTWHGEFIREEEFKE